MVIYCVIIGNYKGSETIQIPINGRIVEQSMVHPHTEIFCRLKKWKKNIYLYIKNDLQVEL